MNYDASTLIKGGVSSIYFPIFEWTITFCHDRGWILNLCLHTLGQIFLTDTFSSFFSKQDARKQLKRFFFLVCQNAEKVAGHLTKAEQTHTKHQISFFWHNITLCSYWSIKRKEESRYTCITSCWRMKRSIRSWTRLWDPSCTSADHEPEHTRVPSPSASATLLSSNKAFEAMHK